jgi:undecaprenyl diphosphate synthase
MANIPRHIAIIMDGNGRWAERRGHVRAYGHVRGCARIKNIVREADRLGVEALTLFAFSTENWSRPDSELRVLWKLLKRYLLKEADELHSRGVRLRVIGEIERLSPEVRAVLDPVVERLSGNTGLQLVFAISYGSRRELSRAARLFAEDCMAGKAVPAEMSEEVLARYLWTRDLGGLADVDLVIRTSGELRVSNFLLWQSAYAEFYFSDSLWPEFTPAHLGRAIEEFSRRERRFGGVDAIPGLGGADVPPARAGLDSTAGSQILG